MIRAITISAYRQYRIGTKQHLNMDYNVLKARLSSLIESVDNSNVSYYSGGKKYRFGDCVLRVDSNNYIRGISWPTDNLKPSYGEIRRLEDNYKRHGLNRQGTRFIEGEKL